jgi:hypothetical protein
MNTPPVLPGAAALPTGSEVVNLAYIAGPGFTRASQRDFIARMDAARDSGATPESMRTTFINQLCLLAGANLQHLELRQLFRAFAIRGPVWHWGRLQATKYLKSLAPDPRANLCESGDYTDSVFDPFHVEITITVDTHMGQREDALRARCVDANVAPVAPHEAPPTSLGATHSTRQATYATVTRQEAPPRAQAAPSVAPSAASSHSIQSSTAAPAGPQKTAAKDRADKLTRLPASPNTKVCCIGLMEYFPDLHVATPFDQQRVAFIDALHSNHGPLHGGPHGRNVPPDPR